MQFVNIYSYETIIKLVKKMLNGEYIGIINFKGTFMMISKNVEENAKH